MAARRAAARRGGRRAAAVLLAAAWAGVARPAAASGAEAWPECGLDVSDPCCRAQRASWDAENAGGCRGAAGNEERCRLAQRLCEECHGSLSANANSTRATATTAAPVTAAEGVELSALDPESLQMRCTFPQQPLPCDGAVADIGLGVVVLAGVLLLVLSSASAAFFDRQLLPPLLVRLKQRLLADTVGAGGAPAPPPPPFSPSALAQLPGDAALKDAEAGVGTPGGTTAGRLGLDTLRLAAAGAGEAAPPSPAAGALPANGTAPPQEPALGVPVPPPGPPPRGRWPERLASIWAGRLAFLYVAEVAVLLRLVHVLFCSLLSVKSSLVHVAMETLVCLVPLVWCAATSRPPKEPQKAWPEAVAYTGPCRRLPRFTTFSVLAVGAELYSTFAAAWVVAMAPCDVEPWRVILPYCLGVVVAVVRNYSAILALRLQDELSHACTRVLPATVLEGAVVLAMAASKELAGATDDFELDVDMADLLAQKRRGKLTEAAATGRRCWWRCCLRPRCRWPCHRGAEEGSSCPTVVVGSPAAGTAFKSASESQGMGRGPLCCGRCRKRPRRWILLFVGLVIVAVSAVASTWVLRALNQNEEERPPSACVTAQNGTATCQQFEIVGMDLYDGPAPDSRMDLADTEEDCCRGCDALNGCQAWMFERAARRCRWIRFLEDPCQGNPGMLRCRCLTHFGTVFGFKPTGRVVWLTRDEIEGRG